MFEVMTGVHVVRTGQRRKTLALEVHPSGEVWVRAPQGCDEQRIQSFVAKREAWIAAQRAFFRQFDPRTPTRAWVAGESHLHLGRRYKLRIALGDRSSVVIQGGDLRVTTLPGLVDVPAAVEALVSQWRHQQARTTFPALLAECLQHYRFQGLAQPGLRIQRLAKRWGSLSTQGNLTLHSGLVQAAPACIRYVMLHELCHLMHADHSPDFYKLLEEVCPKWDRRKHTLELMMR
jgi:predicted metal-dependent hydrolase